MPAAAKKTGRPPLPENKKRRQRAVRFSDDEWAEVVEASRGWGVCKCCKGTAVPSAVICCGQTPRPMTAGEFVRMRCLDV